MHIRARVGDVYGERANGAVALELGIKERNCLWIKQTLRVQACIAVRERGVAQAI